MLGFLAVTVMPSAQQSSLLEGCLHFAGILQRGSSRHGGGHGGGHAGLHGAGQGAGHGAAQGAGRHGCSQTGSQELDLSEEHPDQKIAMVLRTSIVANIPSFLLIYVSLFIREFKSNLKAS